MKHLHGRIEHIESLGDVDGSGQAERVKDHEEDALDWLVDDLFRVGPSSSAEKPANQTALTLRFD